MAREMGCVTAILTTVYHVYRKFGNVNLVYWTRVERVGELVDAVVSVAVLDRV